MALVALGLGSNLGNRLLNLKNAVRSMERSGLRVMRASDVFETAPWGITDQPCFLNACALLECALSPRELLESLKDIEARLGRTMTRRWGERLIDLDILLIDSLIHREADLCVPHPEMHRRGFVLVPLARIIPDRVHPLTGRTIASMASDFPEELRICSL